MSRLFGLAAMIFVAAITPGPNNLAVLNAAAQRGAAGAGSAIAGVLIGSLTLLAVALGGAGTLFATQPWLRDGLSVLGCGYLIWLGGKMIAPRLWSRSRPTHATVPIGVAPLIGLQFTNPKAWVMVLTAVASARGAMTPAAAALALSVLFLTIPTVCLVAWAWLGLRVLRRLERPASREWFDRLLGILLVSSALGLLADVTHWSMPR